MSVFMFISGNSKCLEKESCQRSQLRIQHVHGWKIINFGRRKVNATYFLTFSSQVLEAGDWQVLQRDHHSRPGLHRHPEELARKDILGKRMPLK